MRLTSLTLLATAALTVAAPLAAQSKGAVRFRARDVVPYDGYQIHVADFNNDGRLDVVPNTRPRSANSNSALMWYENPTWEPHEIVSGLSAIVGKAMADLDGDGIPEVAIQSEFSTQAANSEGLIWIARSGGNPEGQWQAEVIDRVPTSHYLVFADLDGDGELELVNAPLVGPGQELVSLFWYGQDGWKRGVMADADVPGVIHRVVRVNWDGGDRDAILALSSEGIGLYRAQGSGASMTFRKDLISRGDLAAPPWGGASDVGVGSSGTSRILASIEPRHGNQVVVYTDQAGDWKRRVIFDQIGGPDFVVERDALAGGHEVVVVDLNDDGYADIIANDNSVVSERNPNASPGVHVFFSPEDPATGDWIYRRVESEAAMLSCVGGDMNNDGRMDFVCGGSGGMIRWYENLGP